LINQDFVNKEIKDKFHQHYQLTPSERLFALISSLILIINIVFGLFY